METLKQDINWLSPEECSHLSIEIENQTGAKLTLKVGEEIPSGKNEHGVLEYSNDIKISRFATENGKITHIMVNGLESSNSTSVFTFDKFLEFIANRLPIDEDWHMSKEYKGQEDDKVLV